jgi:hypothetical protein
MKKLEDRVFRNPLTTLIGIAFAAVGVWILNWSAELTEGSRVFLAILCFGLSITGLGWKDRVFVKVLEIFKNKANLIVFFSFSIAFLSVTGCVTNGRLLKELQAIKSVQESIHNTNRIYFYESQKQTIDTEVDALRDDDLLNVVNGLVRPSDPAAKSAKSKH